MKVLSVSSKKHTQLISITSMVASVVSESGVEDGICTVFVPHTTAAVTINEGADGDVCQDMIAHLDQIIPWEDPKYKHYEGNSSAHLKASLLGNSAIVPVNHHQLALGTWQGIFFCEFDGPRSRLVYVQVIGK